MAINTPHGEKTVQRSSTSKDNDDVPENTQDVPSGHQHETSEECKDSGMMSSQSSQENLPSALSSPYQFPSPLPSPSQRHSFNPSPSQLDSPLSSPNLQPSRLSSSSSLQSPPPLLPSPYHHGDNISIEQLNELALQDSENNNVDENSNQGFDQYAEVDREFVQDQSVRPRVRAAQPFVDRDQPDRAPVNYDMRARIRRRSSGSFTHRRNLSEDLACSPTTNFSFQYGIENDEPLEYDRLPRLPNHHQDRRDEWSSPQPLPPREPTFLQSVRGILPLNLRGGGYGPQPPPPWENTIEDDAQDLLTNFTSETLMRHHLPNPSDVFRQGYRNPTLNRVGQELRQLADAFAETAERRKVQRMAESVHLESINMQNFFQLCTELFKGGITQERIVALFTFVGDVAVYHVRRHGQQFLQVLMTWSWRYLVDHICRWVKEAGGWGVVLSCGANAVYKFAVIAFCMIGTVAAGVYVIKTVKDW